MGINLARESLSAGIVTTNLDAMMDFYVGALGFTPGTATTFPGMGTVQRLEVGHSMLRLFAVETPPPHASPDALRDSTGIRYLTINVADIHEAHEACVNAGVNVPAPPAEARAGAPSFRAQDPDGNWIEFIQEA
jgi:catechol 2,3-dioxygenase-like lactoylglutathione lyase family enzyme